MSPNRAWVLILIGILISSFFGGAIHVLLSPDRITEFVETVVAESEPKFTIDFRAARLRLADGWIPVFAVELDGLKIKAKDACITGAQITADRVVVPLQIIPFLTAKKIRFGVVSARHLKLNWLPPVCRFTPSERSSSTEEIDGLERFFHDRWNIEIVRTTDILEALKVDRFDLVDQFGQLLFSATGFRANLDADHRLAVIRANVNLGPKWVGDADFGEFRLGAEVKSNSVRAGVHGNLKEGQITGDADWNIESGQLRLLGHFADLPVQGLLNLTSHWGVLTSYHSDLRDEWLSCGLSYTGDIRTLGHAQFDISKCSMYGDLGNWQLETTHLAFLHPFPLRWRLAGLNVQRWWNELGMGSAGSTPLSVGSATALIGNFGSFTGDLSIMGPSDISIRGRLLNFSAFISNGQDSVKQKVKSVDIAFAVSPDGIKGTFKRPDIEDGEIAGAGSLDLSVAGDGQIQLTLDRIDLPPTVQHVLWSGSTHQSSVRLLAAMKAYQLQRLDGHIVVNSWQTSDWELRNLDSRLHYDSAGWRLYLMASAFALQPGGGWQTFASLLGNSLSSIQADLLLSADGGTWDHFRAKLAKSEGSIKSEGAWDQYDNLNGTLSYIGRLANIRKRVRQKYAISGSWRAPNLKPL